MSRSTDSSVDSLYPSVCQASKTTFAPPPLPRGGGKKSAHGRELKFIRKGREKKEEIEKMKRKEKGRKGREKGKKGRTKGKKKENKRNSGKKVV